MPSDPPPGDAGVAAPDGTTSEEALLTLLASGEAEVVGRLVESSNNALLLRLRLPHDDAGSAQARAIHKPEAYERPLWDYPDGTLARREHAAYLISRAGGFDVVPPTVERDLGWGRGSLQVWIDGGSEGSDLVEVRDPLSVPDGWRVVLRGEDEEGRAVVLAHADSPGLRRVALFDAVIENSDRKGSHLLAAAGRVWGVDHGVSLSVDPKLRTVLWGWAGEEFSRGEAERLRRLLSALGTDLPGRLVDLLTRAEIEAVADRATRLLEGGTFPRPRPGWPVIPWPAL